MRLQLIEAVGRVSDVEQLVQGQKAVLQTDDPVVSGHQFRNQEVGGVSDRIEDDGLVADTAVEVGDRVVHSATKCGRNHDVLRFEAIAALGVNDTVVALVLDQSDPVDDDAILVLAVVPEMHVVELPRGRIAVFAEVLDQVERVEAGVVRAHEIEVEPARTASEAQIEPSFSEMIV
jgi:hypothetical protein